MALFTFKSTDLPKNLATALQTLSAEYPLCDTAERPNLIYQPGNTGLCIKKSADATVIAYSTLAEALRGTALAMSNSNSGTQAKFPEFGIMLDCSRNGVIRPEQFKRWLRRLALLGYTYAMLYTEDTFQVPEEPIYGYMRGAYTLAELQDLDAYAAKLGIELIPCIQTLGHMEQVVKWESAIRGTFSTLRTGTERVYELLDHVLKFWRQAFRTNKIHIGMDEAWGETGSEFFQPLLKCKFDRFCAHLTRVNELCVQNGYPQPMIWSDTFISLTNEEHYYYGKEMKITPELQAAIPRNVTMVYWDYYHEQVEDYLHMIGKHRTLGFLPVVASSIRTTRSLWYDHALTARTLPPCIAGCEQSKITNFMLTLWGDDGAFCDYDSALAGLAYGADLAWGGAGTIEAVAPVFQTVCQANYEAVLTASEMQLYFADINGWVPYLLWDDPLYAQTYRNWEQKVPGYWEEAERRLVEIARKLAPYRSEKMAGDLNHAWTLVELLIKKIQFRRDLMTAWRHKNLEVMLERAEKEMPQLVDAFAATFREQWCRRNRAEGLERMQYRFAGLAERYRETARLIREYQKGDESALAMLAETRILPVELYFFQRVSSPGISRYN